MSPLDDLLICLRFFSRLPLPATRRETELGSLGLAHAAALVPVAGAVIGIVPALIQVAAMALGLPPLLAAPLSIAALLVVTGALHEDGLADCADGFGGGRDRARKLAIMRDSRIGTFGACAIALSLYIRAASLGVIAGHGAWIAAATVVGAASVSRTACLVPLMLLPPARADGLGARAGRPTIAHFAAALAISIGFGLLMALLGTETTRSSIAIVASFAGALAICGLAWRQIGGQTGDVAGAAQQVAETVFLLVFATTAHPWVTPTLG